MSTRLNPYIGFDGNAREAMEFYKSVFGGELDITTFGEGGGMEGMTDKEDEDKVMHAMLTTPNGLVLMGADHPKAMGPYTHHGQEHVAISVSGDDDAELSGYFDKLNDGATNVMPLTVAPWGDKFGMLTDKFGMNWMVNITKQQ